MMKTSILKLVNNSAEEVNNLVEKVNELIRNKLKTAKSSYCWVNRVGWCWNRIVRSKIDK